MAGTTKKHNKLNPILMKEIKLGSRSIRLPLTVMFYDIVLSMVAVIAILIASATGSSGGGMNYSGFLYIYEVLGWLQIGIMVWIVPILTAGAVSGEREKQTLEIMLTTPQKPISIVWGKLLAALFNFMIYIISSVPIMAIAFVLGGMNWLALLGYICMMVLLAVYIGSIGVFCSCTFKRTIVSIVMTFVIEIAMFVIPIAVFGGVIVIGASAYEIMFGDMLNPPDINFGILPMVMIGNPLTGIFDYMLRTIDGPSVADMIKEMDVFGVIMPVLAHAWIPMNVIVSGAISYFFIAMAARNLNPIRKQKKRSRQKATAGLPTDKNTLPSQPSPQLYRPETTDGEQVLLQSNPMQTGTQASAQSTATQAGTQMQQTASVQDITEELIQPQEKAGLE